MGREKDLEGEAEGRKDRERLGRERHKRRTDEGERD